MIINVYMYTYIIFYRIWFDFKYNAAQVFGSLATPTRACLLLTEARSESTGSYLRGVFEFFSSHVELFWHLKAEGGPRGVLLLGLLPALEPLDAAHLLQAALAFRGSMKT